MNLFDIETKCLSVAPGPRAAEVAEIRAYALWLQERSGLPALPLLKVEGRKIGRDLVYSGATFGDGEHGYSIPFPGANQRQLVTMERLDEAGEVIASQTMPTDAKGATVWKKDAVAAAVGPVAKPKRQPKAKPAMTDREALEAYNASRGAEIERERAEAVAGMVAALVGLIGAGEAAASDAPEPLEAPEAVEATPSAESAPAAAPGEDLAAIEAVGEHIGALIRELTERVARLEAERASPSVESEAATSMDAKPVGMDARRTPARERLLRRYLAMRAQRDLDRRALIAGNDYTRQVQAERDALRAEAAKPQHRNEADAGLVAQLHDEKAAHRLTRENAKRREDGLEQTVIKLADDLVALKGRAIRAEQALQLYRRPMLPLLPSSHAGAVARVTYGAAQ